MLAAQVGKGITMPQLWCASGLRSTAAVERRQCTALLVFAVLADGRRAKKNHPKVVGAQCTLLGMFFICSQDCFWRSAGAEAHCF